jgi:hypothetical protein
MSHSSDPKNRLERMRDRVLEWLSGRTGNADAETGAVDPDVDQQNSAIAQRFLLLAGAAGFACNVVEVARDGAKLYEVQWTHRGAGFVGFKQPPPQENVDNALLAGCAALLENDWCRNRLPVE